MWNNLVAVCVASIIVMATQWFQLKVITYVPEGCVYVGYFSDTSSGDSKFQFSSIPELFLHCDRDQSLHMREQADAKEGVDLCTKYKNAEESASEAAAKVKQLF